MAGQITSETAARAGITTGSADNHFDASMQAIRQGDVAGFLVERNNASIAIVREVFESVKSILIGGVKTVEGPSGAIGGGNGEERQK